MQSGTDRVAAIVRRLRTFARLDQADLQQADVHDGIEDTLLLIHHELKHGIDVVKEFGVLPTIHCYPGQLNQVFLNMFINAQQAMDSQGTLTIRTSHDEDKNCVVIQIEDTGKGIAPEHLDRVFDPGFTTKGVGVGTGLGLSICYNIVRQHKGEIEVESEVGKGTVFRIMLPTDLDRRLGQREETEEADAGPVDEEG
jgi:signal transduction histidine kinase